MKWKLYRAQWNMGEKDSSKSSRLDHYVAAGLASVSVLYVLVPVQ